MRFYLCFRVQKRAVALGFRVEYTNDKGRVCMADRAFEPGQVGTSREASVSAYMVLTWGYFNSGYCANKVIFEDEALVHGSSSGDGEGEDEGAWCLECDSSHQVQTRDRTARRTLSCCIY